ncbi:MAG: cation transporter [Candidatus Omnitrophota bacterium]|jgi:cobalt-zinc-cadmium efflux system protein|nr:MAG: cation transporter [Candidatus Omnitrophota bacterium]
MSLEHTHHNRIVKISRLRLAIAFTGLGMVIEIIGGFMSNSLALISDAGHMLTHMFALGMSYFALLLSGRPATKKRTYGYYRAEVLAAFINGIVLILISFYLIYEAILRFISPEPIKISEMLLVAVIGLAINGTSTFLLAKVSNHDLNIRSALLHEIGDMISSVAVVAAGIIIFYTGNYIVDPILSLFICLLIIIWAVKLLIDSGNILLESAPKHLDIDAVIAALKSEIKGVYEVHHVHAWTISSSMYALTAHVVIEDCSISQANELLKHINNLVKEKFHISHTNIQFECLIKKEAHHG